MAPEPQQQAIPAQAGIGLRLPHQRKVLESRPRAAWFEVHPENYMADAEALAQLLRIRADYSLSLHAVGLSLGSAGGVSPAHIVRLAQLERQLAPALLSDHLSWSVADAHYLPDLLPLPYTDEALAVVCRNVAAVQEGLGRRLLLENPSSYLAYTSSVIPEHEFLAEVAARSGCGVLLDLNNIYVSACNLGADAASTLAAWLRALRPGDVQELHLAGHAFTHTATGHALRIDDHGDHVCVEVWALYEQALAALGAVPTLIEWDTRLPAFDVLQAEAEAAQQRLDAISTPYQARAHAR
jgi:uncharacterized protein (UPF0276 family)